MPKKNNKVDLAKNTIKPTKPKKLKKEKKPKREINKPIKGEKSIRSKFFLIVKIFVIILALLIIGAIAFSYNIIASTGEKIIEKENKSSFLKQISMLITSPDKKLQGEESDRINFLLLGMGGEEHTGGRYLTDTIIIASYRPSTNEVAMLSIPRDLVVEIDDNHWYRKINNAYALGQSEGYPGGGIALSKKLIEEVINQDIHYWLTVDFEGFRRIIDTLGGVEVCVENAFTDYQFPDYNFGYQTIHFNEGCQAMDGETALQYARSRKGNAGEGSDFARSKRQQQIITNTRNKALSIYTLINPNKINNIFDSLGDHIKTNMEIWEMINLAKLTTGVDTNTIITRVLDNSNDGILHSEIVPETGAYVLIPDAGLGDYSDIHKIAKNIFDYVDVKKENAKIEIQNGTTISGLALSTKNILDAEGYNITDIGNASVDDNQKTVIYDLTGGQMPNTVKTLKQTMNANIANTIPLYLLTDVTDINYDNLNNSFNTNIANLRNELEGQKKQSVDLIIVLGFDQDKTNANINNSIMYQ